MFIKIDLNKTGPIRSVVFYSTERNLYSNNAIKNETGYREVNLPQFANSPDYFQASLGDLVSHWWNRDDATNKQHEGAFFVERADGVRLWANPSSNYGEHFLFDEGTAKTLYSNGQIYLTNSTVPYGAATLTSLGQVMPTANYNTYLNPQRCR